MRSDCALHDQDARRPQQKTFWNFSWQLKMRDLIFKKKFGIIYMKKEIGNFTFISSALYDPITDGKFKGRRHHEIIKAMQEEGYPSHIVKRCVQGFMIKHCDDKEE